MSVMLKSIPPEIVSLRDQGVLRDIDIYLAESLKRSFGAEASAASLLAVCLVHRILADGHICLNRDDLSSRWLAGLVSGEELDPENLSSRLDEMLKELQCSDLVEQSAGLIAPPERVSPLVLANGCLYLRRYWIYEQTVAEKLSERARASDEDCGPVDLSSLCLNPKQSEALKLALAKKFVVISGGPGTGKTYTAARILYLLARAQAGLRPPIIRMAAPTGKAADRLNASVEDALAELGTAVEIEDACTIERLLGYLPSSPYFKHNRDNRLPADVVLIDEASMLDLPKMAKLLEALKPACRLIMLGDMHQLASVAPGSVLGDICSSAALEGSVVELVESRRFEPGGSIARLSSSINRAVSEADADEVWSLLEKLTREEGGRVKLERVPEQFLGEAGAVDDVFAGDIIRGYRDFVVADLPERAFTALNSFQVLCAVRRGPHGVDAVNRLIEKILAGTGADGFELPESRPDWRPIKATGEFYDHRVIMITRNDYSMDLFNGDIGIIMPDRDPQASGILFAYFQGGAPDGECRRIPCRLLPEHETAFAITVHKSQGSEFDNVLVLLPPTENPIVTKELIYTAITRARKNVKIRCEKQSFKKAVRTKNLSSSNNPPSKL